MQDIFEARHKAPKMLIADDDPAIVRLLADRCVKMGFKVETATNGIQLLIKARRSQPDILIIDVNMPELDGLSVCTRLLDPGSKPVEVVVVTGSWIRRRPSAAKAWACFTDARDPISGTASKPRWPKSIPPGEQDRRLEIQSMDAEVPERPRVLVVDDDPDMETFLASRLGKFGVDTLYAPDAVQGFRIACKEKPTVIITDNFMPDGDAQYLLYRLRSTPATENIPVFVISGRRLSEPTEQILKREICGRPGAAQFSEIVRHP